MTSTMTARQRMQAARVSLIYDEPFWGALSLRLKMIEDPGCGTAYTDGVVLGYDPEFVKRLTHDETVFLTAHEVAHCALGHMWRRDGREMQKWNVAADFAVNQILVDAGFRLVEGGYLDAAYKGRSSEWIYARLPDPQKDGQQGCTGTAGGSKASGQGQGKGKGRPSPGNAQGGAQGEPGQRPGTGGQDVRDAPTGAEAGQEPVTEADWQQAVQQAAAAAKARGNLPASLDRFAKAAAQAKVDWKSVLRRFIQQAARADYSWSRPSTRHLARGLYLPSLRSEAMGPIAVAVDTSGSIDGVTLSAFFAEINAVASEVRPSRVTIIYCDAAIQRVEEFEPDDVIEPKPKGGGGTSHVPVMDFVDAMEELPVCLIALTDLMTAHRPEPPGMPVLWAATRVADVPYGEVISLENT